MLEHLHGADKSAPTQIKDACLRLLTRREHSQKELLIKLIARGFDKADILPIVTELTEQGLQSDARYAESYARYRIQRGFGAMAISYELKQNGVENINLEPIMLAFADSWLELLEQLYQKKYPTQTHISRAEWGKRSRFLMQRGFSSSLINALFQQLHLKFSS